MSNPLEEPPIFFIPTSFALLDACAVERFMKLIAAIITIRIAMLPEYLQKLRIARFFKLLLD